MDLTKAKSFKGYIGKESPSLFGGYQKRFFQIISGDLSKGESYLLTYADKEGGTVKGAIPFKQISDITSTNKKEFSFLVGDRKFKLKAENEQSKNEWIEALKIVKDEAIRVEKQMEIDGNVRGDSLYSSKSKGWKIENQSKDVVNALSNQGVSVGKEQQISEKCLDLKGIRPLIRGINPELLKTRMKFGFLHKKHKSNFMSSQKRWLFLLSSRPLNYNDQFQDEETLDPSSLPSSIKFDTLYYYSLDDEKDNSTFKGELEMHECSRISTKENDKEFYIIIDMNDRIFEFTTEVGWERDSWFEALKNSKKTGKDVELSKTKKPRNMTKLLDIFQTSGINAVEKIIDNEITTIIKGFEEIKNHQILSALIKKIDNKLLQLVDGCLLCNPIPMEVLKSYCEKFNSTVLNKIQVYWKYLSENLSADQILDLIEILYKQEEKLNTYGIEDPNFCINGKELVKIFTRKIIMNLQTLIESILKNEREYKALKTEQDDGDLLLTNGPVDLFRTFYKTFDMMKNFKIKDLHSEVFKMFKECILLYLIGVDIVISRADLVIDNEFLIGVCNNSIKISSQISDFIDDAKSYSVLSENDICDFLGQKSILKSLNFISETAMSRLVFELCSSTFKTFILQSFFEINIETIVEEINKNLENFVEFMHFSTQKKYWTEVLKSTVFSYTKSIFNIDIKKRNLEELTDKIAKDKNVFVESFDMLGSNQLEEETKILDLIRDFLSVDIDMFSFSVANIKTKMGKGFNLKTAKLLIELRKDWSSDERKEALTSCQEILENYDSKSSADSKAEFHDEFFKQLHDDLQKEQKLDQISEDKEFEQDRNLRDVGDTPKKDENRRKTLMLDSFLDDLDNNENEADNESDKSSNRSSSFKRQESSNSLDELTDVVKEGYLNKKSSKNWQERYFQLKNKKFYWYQNKESNLALNYIDLEKVLKMPFSHKPSKFTLYCDKEYKFECSNEDEALEWIDAIKNEILKIKNNKKIVQLFQIELKKKVIAVQNMSLPTIYSYKATMKNKVMEAMKGENFFQPKTKPNEEIINQKDTRKKHSVLGNEMLFNPSKLYSGDPVLFSKQDTMEALNIDFDGETPRQKGFCASCWEKIRSIFS